jgi:catechol 2,3-dioxygenase-like lactoylglutathione lyase family enzyme
MQKRSVFTNVMVKRFVRANLIPAVHPPAIPPNHALEWRESDPALNAFLESVNSEVGSARYADRTPQRGVPTIFSVARAMMVLSLVLLALSTKAGVREVSVIGLTVNDLGTELNFFTNTLPFELVSVSEISGKEEDALLGLKHVKLRVAELKLGAEPITLTEHLGGKGRPIPVDSRSFDHWFQHIAIVVSDMDKAYAQLREHRVKYVSTEPQTLPAWNKGAAGIKAFYFRDPENHVLEIICFPAGKGDPKWQAPTTNVFLGIDHTALVVSDTEKSLAFYRDVLGLHVAGGSENYGVEQEHLNQVFGARLRITALRADRGPGIEFLEYLTPPGGREVPPDAKANDLIFWNTHLFVGDEGRLSATLREQNARFVSKQEKNLNSQIVRDPDGHALELDQENNAVAQK